MREARLAGEVVAEEETITLGLPFKMLAEQGAVAKFGFLVGR